MAHVGMSNWTPDTCRGMVEVAGDTLRPGGLELSEHLLGLGNFQTGSRVLDAGCGMGATLGYMSQTLRLTTIGVDSSEKMLMAARRNTKGIPLICSPLERMPFADGSFDGVICECVLSLTDTPAVLVEFHRVVRAAGLLLVTDLYRRQSGQSCASALATKEQIATMLEHAGFTIEQWEDRTPDLRRLAAQLIMAFGSDQGCFWDKAATGIPARDVGYHLLVARRSA